MLRVTKRGDQALATILKFSALSTFSEIFNQRIK